MGFEQLAALRDRLRAETEKAKAGSAPPPNRKTSTQKKPRNQDSALEAIWPLQKHFPLAFPVNPAPKVPLKEGILKDAEQHLELLGITHEQLKLGISTWCRGSRYWTSMIENAARLDLNGQAVGTVTASQALHAKQQASRQRAQARRNNGKQKARVSAPDANADANADADADAARQPTAE